MTFAEFLTCRGVKLRPCEQRCPGFFLDSESGRWQRCDDCAGRSLPRGYVHNVDDDSPREAMPFDDEDVRAFVKLVTSGGRAQSGRVRARAGDGLAQLRRAGQASASFRIVPLARGGYFRVAVGFTWWGRETR